MKKGVLIMLILGFFLITTPVLANSLELFNFDFPVYENHEIKIEIQEVNFDIELIDIGYCIEYESPGYFIVFISTNNNTDVGYNIKLFTLLAQRRGGFLHFARHSQELLQLKINAYT